jgi:hypothetical protein
VPVFTGADQRSLIAEAIVASGKPTASLWAALVPTGAAQQSERGFEDIIHCTAAQGCVGRVLAQLAVSAWSTPERVGSELAITPRGQKKVFIAAFPPAWRRP